MAIDKRYYWVKLDYRRFENGGDMDFLMGQKNGAEYVVLYMMLCLNTRNTDGELVSRMGEVIIPYDVDKIVRDCKYFMRDTVIVALELYKKLGLIYAQEDGILRVSDFENLVGSETPDAQRKRIERANKKLLASNSSETNSGQCPQNVTQEIRDKSKEYRDKSIENKRENIEISNSSSKEDSLSISCGEPSEKVSPPKNKEPENEAIFLSMPLATVDENGNSEEVGIPVSWVEKMKTLYPTLDVEGEIRKAVAWCISNPKNRKTKSGWQRYLNNWFNRAINTATRYPTSADKPSEKKATKEQLIERFKGTKVVVL